MRFVADENVDAGIVDALRDAGHEVLYVAELESGMDDEAVLEQARSKRAVLVTSDKDFGELVHRQGRASGGVLLLRLAGLRASEKADLVRDCVARYSDQLAHSFSVLNRHALRIRPAPPG